MPPAYSPGDGEGMALARIGVGEAHRADRRPGGAILRYAEGGRRHRWCVVDIGQMTVMMALPASGGAPLSVTCTVRLKLGVVPLFSAVLLATVS